MNKPEKRIRCGAISASIWVDRKTVEGKTVEYHSISITKSYKDGDEWKHTNNFNTDDLPKIALVANEVYRYIRLISTDSNEQNVEPQ
ncbi:MAG: hypothetical protein JXA96_13255 [Sedimentisphaerales bacterium]|nr:hypothetical protein [Sedimentisphaerales bacterium]